MACSCCTAPELQLICSMHILQAYKAVDSAIPVEDRNLPELAALPRLKELDISKDPAFADADCRKLAKLTSLETLHIRGKPIRDSGFRVRTSPPLLWLHGVSQMCWLSMSSRCCCGSKALTLF